MKLLMRISIACFLCFGIGNIAFSAAPSWTVNVNDYSNSMTVTGAINIDFEESRDENDIVAAFVNGTCRGIANPIYVPQIDRYIAFLLIYGDIANQQIEFKVYDASTDDTRVIDTKMLFKVNGITGSATDPYIWSNPTLSSNADIVTFDFGFPVSSTQIIDDTVFVEVPYLTDLSNLTANFATSPHAYVRVNDSLQESGTSANDFTSVIAYDVESADETNNKRYYIKVIIADASPTGLFISDSVIVETALPDTWIADFEVEDADGQGVNSITLTSNTSTDNSSFSIINEKLYSATAFDYENKSSYIVEAEVTNELGFSLIKQFTIYIEDENDEVPYIVHDTLYVSESETTPSLIHTLLVDDNDSTPAFKQHTFLLLSGNDDVRFSLNKQTGEIFLINNLDFESTTLTYELEFEVSDGVFSTSETIIVVVQDENDGVPQVSSKTINVLEITSIGEDLTKINATDTDANTSFDYTIKSGNDEEIFSINDSTGIITLVDSLDYERTTNYFLEIEVNDGVNTGTGYLTINVVNVNDEYPVVEIDTVQLSEFAVLGQIVHTVSSTDPDQNTDLRYTISNGNIGPAFTINPGYGIITVLQKVDFEDIEKYFLEVTVDDGGLKTVVIIVVDIINENDEYPEVKNNTTTINETIAINTIIDTVLATDEDELLDLRYSIQHGNPTNTFEIDSASGIIRTLMPLDYEFITRYQLTIAVFDGANTSFCTRSFELNNENDEKPTIEDNFIEIEEDFAEGSILTEMIASDIDNLGGLSYHLNLVKGAPHFSIDSSTGVVRSDSLIDYETIPRYEYEVIVSDGLQSDTAFLTIQLINLDDEPAIVDTMEVYLFENATLSTVLDTVSAFDPDGFSDFQYAIKLKRLVPLFDVDINSGVVYLDGELDYESDTLHKFEIEVSSGGGEPSLGQVIVHVLDVNDNAPTVHYDSTNVSELAETNDSLLQVRVSDVDQNPVFNYAIMNDTDSLFTIDSLSGTIRLAANLDYEQTTKYSLKIAVSDGLFTSYGFVIVQLIDENDEIPEMIDTNYVLSEYTASNTSLGTLQAIDRDANSEFEFTLLSENDLFDLASDGYLSTIAPLDYETKTEHQLLIEISDGFNVVTDTILVEVEDENEELFVPNNTISPNNDGVNDYWVLDNLERYESCYFEIYNHLGHLVYTSEGYANDWDGTHEGEELPTGTYYYLVDCESCSCQYTGFISLVR